MKKFFIISVLIIIFICTQLTSSAKDSYGTYFKKGEKALAEQEYTKAINELTKALNLASKNSDVKEDLINAYILRGDKNKDKEYGKSANDYRSALFYIEFFIPENTKDITKTILEYVKNQLENSLKHLSYKKSPQESYYYGYLLESAGEYAAAGYEYIQASKDKKLNEKSNKGIERIIKKLGFKNINIIKKTS